MMFKRADNSIIEYQLEALKRQKKRGQLRLKKPTRQQVPKMLEMRFAKEIRKRLNKAKEIIRANIVAAIPGILSDYEIRTPQKADSWRFDETVAEKLAQLFAATRGQLDEVFTKDDLQFMSLNIAEATSDFQKKQIDRAFKSVLGVEVFAQEPWLEELSKGFALENATLIKDVSDQFIKETERVVFEGVRRGSRAAEIGKSILGSSKNEQGFVSRFRKAETRANTIARDQINKFYGKLNEARQVNVGVKEYIWRTALDDRVRDEHADREGQKFSWDDPPFDGHPGEPINCRCFAEPVLEDLV